MLLKSGKFKVINVILSKTDFIHYLKCPESFWLGKNKPEEYPKAAFSLFLQRLITEGYKVESYVNSLFENVIILPNFASPQQTAIELNKNGNVFVQTSFETAKGVFARIDVLEKIADGSWHLYEVKSSTKVSTKKDHNHIYDVCFQKYVLEQNELSVSKCSVIHVNGEFVKNGLIKGQDLLTITEVTDDVEKVYSNIVNEIHEATKIVQLKSYLNEGCSCLFKTRANHCETFDFFNTSLPKPTIYELKRLSEKKVKLLVEQENFGLIDIPKDFELSEGQQLQYLSFIQDKPIVNATNINKTLSELTYPLHFFDYEAYGSAIPKMDGLKPFEQVPFQVSIHTMTEDGQVTHFEYLGEQLEFPEAMLRQMEFFTKQEGTFISWHASYEIGANNRMKTWIPKYESYLEYINTHMFDLEKIFYKDYIDYRFKGSSSIKKVLPVLVPNLSYDDLNVQDGTMAMDTWEKIAFDGISKHEKEQTRKNLLEYCKLDTLAMVEIYRHLKN